MSEEPRNEAEFLERESQLAREALLRLRSEMLESLGRTADVSAWTERYPWPALGTAATAGIATGWALGSTFRRISSIDNRGSPADQAADESTAMDESAAQRAAEVPPAANRLVTGLGTLTGVLASAAFAAATEALTEVVKESVHGALHPEQEPDAPAADEAASSNDQTSSNGPTNAS